MQEIRTLELGKPIERELKGGEVHLYQITLAAGQYMHVVVEQRGIDVVVSFIGPDGKLIVERDSPTGMQGKESASLIAEASGTYHLQVRSLEKEIAAGRYNLKIEELRQAHPMDRIRFAAETAFSEGGLLSAYGTAEFQRKALEKYKNALQYWRIIADSQKEAETLHNIGDLYYQLNEYPQALEHLKNALPLWQKTGDVRGEGYTLQLLGGIHGDLSEQQEGLKHLARALPLMRAIDDRVGEAQVLNTMGMIYSSLGELEKAREHYDQAFQLFEVLGDRRGQATTLNNIGGIYDRVGETQKALNCYFKALPLRRAVNDRVGEAYALTNIGAIYSDLRENHKALTYYDQALAIIRAIGHRYGEATLLNNIGGVYSVLDENQKALDCFNQVLKLIRDIGDRRGEAHTLTNMGEVYSSLGQRQIAIEHYDKALALFQATGDRRGEAYVLHSFGLIFHELGESEKAFNYYNQALILLQAMGDRNGEAKTIAEIARIERDRKNFTEARAKIELALSIAESLRTKVAGPDLRASYFAAKQKYYAFYIDLLAQLQQRSSNQTYGAAAFQVSERAHARALLDILNEAKANIRRGVSSHLLKKETEIFRAIAKLQTDLREKQLTEAQKTEINMQLSAEEEKLSALQLELRQSNPKFADLQYPHPLKIAEVQNRLLTAQDVLLEYALGEEHSYLWAVTKNKSEMFQLPPQKEIEEQVQQFLARVNREPLLGFSPTPLGKVLYDSLIAPSSKFLQNQTNLIIIPDGILHYLPFEALVAKVEKSQPQYLIEKMNISYGPSASVLAFLKSQKPASSPSELLAFGDPVFGDERAAEKREPVAPDTTAADSLLEHVTERGLYEAVGFEFKRLPNTGDEIQNIASHFDSTRRLLYMRGEAKEERLKAATLRRFRYLHFATHGLLNEQVPGRSAIVLTLDDDPAEDGFLQINEIFNLDLDADLVTLSACQTAKGKLLRGEGVVGMMRAFMYAGARSLLVSLWPVQDKPTADFMPKFYGYLKAGRPKNEALRQAKLEFIRSETDGLRHPYFWAPFVLSGSSR